MLGNFYESNVSTSSELILRFTFKYKSKNIFINEAPGVKKVDFTTLKLTVLQGRKLVAYLHCILKLF